MNFLYLFLRVLIEAGRRYDLTPEDEKALFAAIERVYKLPAEIRTLTKFASILGPLGERLHRWTRAGQFGHLFDNPEDTLTFSRFQTFNFDGWSDCPDILEPLLFCVQQRASSKIEKPANTATFKVFVIDEAWIFLKNATISDWILRAEKTWRKKNAAMVLATQSVVELAASDMLHIVNESCPTKIFLSNPNIDRRMYAEIFQLNDTQLELLESLVPKRELLLIQPRGTKKVGTRSRCTQLLDGDQQRPRQPPQTGLLRRLRAGARLDPARPRLPQPPQLIGDFMRPSPIVPLLLGLAATVAHGQQTARLVKYHTNDIVMSAQRCATPR